MYLKITTTITTQNNVVVYKNLENQNYLCITNGKLDNVKINKIEHI